MTTDTKWSWTILMRDGESWHFPNPITIEELLYAFYADGHHETEIEAIIRH